MEYVHDMEPVECETWNFRSGGRVAMQHFKHGLSGGFWRHGSEHVSRWPELVYEHEYT